MFSLPDWAFYPLAAAVTGGMVAGALAFGDATQRTPEQIRAEGMVYEGDTLNALTTGNGLEASVLIEGDTSFLRITAARGPFDGMQSAGAFFALSPDELEALQGHRIRLSFDVRAGGDQPAEGVRFNLFLPGIGQNGWTRYPVGEDFETVTFDISPPTCVWDHGYIGIWPDWDFERNTIDLRRVELTALEEIEC
jgi:hypothetical protein